MTAAWSPDELALIDAADELEIAVRRADGTLRRWTPIWVVRVGDRVHVRTWYRRDTGWFGQVLKTGRARVRVPRVEVDVLVDDVGDGPAERRAGVDDAFRTKYARYGHAVDAMVADRAAETTLQLHPQRGA